MIELTTIHLNKFQKLFEKYWSLPPFRGSTSPQSFKILKLAFLTFLGNFRQKIFLQRHRLILLSMPSPYKQKLPSPQLIWAEIPFWDLSKPLVEIHKYPARPFSTPSLTSTQDKSKNNDKIICAADQQLGLHHSGLLASDKVCSSLLFLLGPAANL